MKKIKFPVKLVFRISTFSNDFRAYDADERVVAYVKQKKFKLKESISIYNDTTKEKLIYSINADRWLDFSAAYNIKDEITGTDLGKVARDGMRSIWKAKYELIDQHDDLQFTVREKNAWVKVGDSILGDIPIVGMFTGYFFNPQYEVKNQQGQVVARLKKQRSLVGRKFMIEKAFDMEPDDEERILLGLMMMVLLERKRG